jgi:hypothetical protein
MQPNHNSLVNMATNSTRNTSVAQDNLTVAQMWPNATMLVGEKPNYTDGATVVMTPSLKKQLDDSVAKAKMKVEAVKFDDGKVDWTLVPFEALEGMAQVLTFGAKKYDSWNWTTGGGFKWTRVLASCMRHLFAFMRGEDNDPESGLSHISHAQCNLLFLAYYIRNKNKFPNDDRYVR